MAADGVIAKSKIKVILPFLKKLFVCTICVWTSFVGFFLNICFLVCDTLNSCGLCQKFFLHPVSLTFFCRSSLKIQKGLKKIQNLAILATWKLGSGSKYSPKNLHKPINRYSESWVDSSRKMFHQISFVMSSSGVNIENSKTVAKNAICQPAQISKYDRILPISIYLTHLTQFLLVILTL